MSFPRVLTAALLTLFLPVGLSAQLDVLDSASVRKHRIDPYVAHLTKGGTGIELEHKETNDVAEKLDIKIKVKKQQPGKGALVIRFGPHALTAPLKIHLVR